MRIVKFLGERPSTTLGQISARDSFPPAAPRRPAPPPPQFINSATSRAAQRSAIAILRGANQGILSRRGFRCPRAHGIILTCNIFVTEEEESTRRRAGENYFLKLSVRQSAIHPARIYGPSLVRCLVCSREKSAGECNSKGNCLRGLAVSQQFFPRKIGLITEFHFTDSSSPCRW